MLYAVGMSSKEKEFGSATEVARWAKEPSRYHCSGSLVQAEILVRPGAQRSLPLVDLTTVQLSYILT